MLNHFALNIIDCKALSLILNTTKVHNIKKQNHKHNSKEVETFRQSLLQQELAQQFSLHLLVLSEV